MKAKIDTLELVTPLDNTREVEGWNSLHFTKEKSVRIKPNGEVLVVLHPSRVDGRYNYSDESYKYTYYKNKKEEMLNQMQIQVKENTDISRLDVCIDLEEDFTKMYPIFNILIGLYLIEVDTKKAWENVDYFTRKANGLNAITRHKELYIYDKAFESNGLHRYKSRVEFRFKSLRSTEESKKLKDLMKLLDALASHYEQFESIRIENLYQKYLSDTEQGKVYSFTEFVRANKDIISTMGIFKGLYEKVGLKGSASNWIKKYRKTNTITFYSKTEVKGFISEMKRAVKTYSNN